MQHALSILAMFVGTGSLTNLDDLNIIRRIKSDKISDMTINVFFFLEEQLKMDLLDDMFLTINAFQRKKVFHSLPEGAIV